jgi:archaeal flagellin N-terminal-like domain
MSDIKAFLFDDDRGVSPVIGVILMVAITVILAAVIAAFVLGLGDTNGSTPNVTWEYDYDQSTNQTEVQMTGGDSFDPARVTVTGDIDSSTTDSANITSDGASLADVDDFDPGDRFTAGDSVTVNVTGVGFEFDLVFTSEDGGTSSTIGGTSGPDA